MNAYRMFSIPRCESACWAVSKLDVRQTRYDSSVLLDSQTHVQHDWTADIDWSEAATMPRKMAQAYAVSHPNGYAVFTRV